MDGALSEKSRILISEADLNALILKMLRSNPLCADVRSVALDQVRGTNSAYTWEIIHFDPGKGDRYICKRACRSIHEKLGGTYDMVGRS